MPDQKASMKDYLAALPAERRAIVTAVRKAVKSNLDKAFREGLGDLGISYVLPLSKYPAGYHCDPKQPLPFATIANMKGHVGLYFFGLYCLPEEVPAFKSAWKASGCRLDMGASCIRIKTLDGLPADVLGAAVKKLTAARFVAGYEAALAGNAARRKKA